MIFVRPLAAVVSSGTIQNLARSVKGEDLIPFEVLNCLGPTLTGQSTEKKKCMKTDEARDSCERKNLKVLRSATIELDYYERWQPLGRCGICKKEFKPGQGTKLLSPQTGAIYRRATILVAHEGC